MRDSHLHFFGVGVIILTVSEARENLAKLRPSLRTAAKASLNFCRRWVKSARFLMERYLTCGNSDCKCARGERHGRSGI